MKEDHREVSGYLNLFPGYCMRRLEAMRILRIFDVEAVREKRELHEKTCRSE